MDAPTEKSTAAIELRDVWRRFKADMVLRGLEFSVQPGEVFALLGRNGAGKTTALRTALGLLKPHRGEARVFGMPALELSDQDRQRIGVVAEDHPMPPDLSLRAMFRIRSRMNPRFDEQAAVAAAKRAELPLDKRLFGFSRGMRGQAAVILAVHAQPDLLIFDDPALGLDVAKRREVLDLVIELLADSGSAVLFTSHAFADVERLADRVGFLHDGHLIADVELGLRSQIRTFDWQPEKPGDAELLLGDPVASVEGVPPGPKANQFKVTVASEDAVQPFRARGRIVDEPVAPTLEDLFLTMTSQQFEPKLPQGARS